jgi:hypothetical protein
LVFVSFSLIWMERMEGMVVVDEDAGVAGELIVEQLP